MTCVAGWKVGTIEYSGTNGQATGCIECGAGRYSEQSGQSACIGCTEGQYICRKVQRAKSCPDFQPDILCASGFHQPSSDQSRFARRASTATIFINIRTARKVAKPQRHTTFQMNAIQKRALGVQQYGSEVTCASGFHQPSGSANGTPVAKSCHTTFQMVQTAENTLAGAANALQAVTLKTLVKALATPAMLENTKMEMVAHPAVLEDSQLERAAAAHHVHMEDINHMEVVFHALNATLEAFRTTLKASHATLATVESSCPTKGNTMHRMQCRTFASETAASTYRLFEGPICVQPRRKHLYVVWAGDVFFPGWFGHALAAPRVSSLVRQHWTTARVASRALQENIKHKQGRLRVYLVLKENPQIRQHWTTARVASRAPKENIKPNRSDFMPSMRARKIRPAARKQQLHRL